MTPEFKSFFKTVVGNEGSKCRYPTRLNLYGRGCAHDCAYCYARSLLAFRGLWHPEQPAVANIRRMGRRLDRIAPGTILRLGGMTDCFQPVERRHRMTYRTIRMLNERRIGYLIVTKSALVADDEYTAVYDPALAHIQVSITDTDDRRIRRFERASPPSQRIRAVEKLEKMGFDVAVRLSPYIPGHIDFSRLNAIRCRKLLVEFLRINSWIKRRMPIDTSEYTLSHGGYRHMPLEAKIRYLEQITGFEQVSVCEDVTEHYVYWRDHFNPNPEDCCNLKD